MANTSKGPALPADPAWGPRKDLTLLNTDIRRVDGPEKVTGRAVYTHDVRVPGMLYARVAKYPMARASLESVDTTAAEGLPGVVKVMKVKDGGDDVRFSGSDSIVAVVAAETPEAAMDGVRAIAVVAEKQPPVVSPEAARADDAPVISRRRRATSNYGGEDVDGDEAEALAKLGEVESIEVTVHVPVQHHVCLETHGHVVVPPVEDGAEGTVYASTQNVSGLPGQFRRTLGAARVVTPHMGGGFGSKFGAGIEGKLCAELATETGRPVHLMLSRSDEFTMTGNRSGALQSIKLGADAEGNLLAMHSDVEKLGGMAGGSHAGAPYRYDVPTAYSRIRSLKTATDGTRAMRAPGHPEASFGMETAVDMLAAKLGVDPLEMRKRNLPSATHRRQLDVVAREIGWLDHPHRTGHGTPENGVGVGIGFGVCGWWPGGAPSQCDVTVHPDGRVISATATQDLGTGARTYVAAIVAEELGLKIDQVTPRIGDSDLPPSVASGGSVTTGSSAPAVKDAAHKAREALEGKLVDVLGAEVGDYLWKDGRVHVKADRDTSLAWAEVCALLGSPLRVSGKFQKDLYKGGGIHGAQAARVEVDTMTGRVKVLKMVAIQDQGLPLNRMALRSQINGGMVQALSYGLLEQRVFDEADGYLLSDNLDLYKIAAAQEIPEMISIIDDEDEREAVCGMAEATIIPGHSAIGNAIYNACGARLTRMPFTPDNVLEAIHGKV